MRWHGWRRAVGACLLTVLLINAGQALQARVEAEALVGRPFGVARVTISGLDVAIDANRVLIEERNGRVFYPVATPGVLGRLIGQILGDPAERPAAGITIYFLFRGDDPLDLSIHTPQALPLTVQPQVAQNPRLFDRQLTQWWRQYNAYWRQLRAENNHPPLISTYLTAMLSQRMGLEPPLLERLQTRESSGETRQSIELLLGLERLRLQTLRDTMLGRGDFGEAANLPLPREVDWSPLALPADLPSTEIEPIALRVPGNWFYIRFGSFSNYLWLDNLVEEYGGDISSMVTLRSYVPPMGQRVQQQLGLEKSSLARVLGPHLIADVALVGRDTFTREGAAIGMLFHAKDTDILRDDLSQQRKRALDRAMHQGATAETATIAGREVSFYSTPDNRLRSFYVVVGDFHLVTTSRAMVEEFCRLADEATAGRLRAPALGRSAEFRFARQMMPLNRQDTIFVYFSSAFFEGLLSPHYQAELARRMKSVTDMELLELARLAGEAEGVRRESIEDLIDAGLLPRGFGRRPDGSGPVVTQTGMLDSVRGARGAFAPIPDVIVGGITRGEAARLDSLSASLARQWRRMDPLMIGIQRYALEGQRERVIVDGNVAPLDETKYGWVLSMLGPPTRQVITTAEGDVIAVQASVRGGLLSPSIPPHHLFLGIQDIPPLSQIPTTGLLQTLNLLRSTPGYLGSYPRAGFLDLLPLNLGGSAPDPDGFSRLPLGLWRRQGGGFSVLSFDPVLLANITPQLRLAESETEAQIRIHVEDLSQSKIRPWITSLYYQRALAASAGNSRLLTDLNQQLHVPMDQAKEVAEELLDGRLSCPLGGEYKIVEDLDGGARTWQSTAWANRSLATVPDDFEAPLLKWFRGLDAHLNKAGDQLVVRLELDMERHPTAPKFDLPLFNLFGGSQRALKPKEDPKAEELPPPLPPVRNPPRRDTTAPREL